MNTVEFSEANAEEMSDAPVDDNNLHNNDLKQGKDDIMENTSAPMNTQTISQDLRADILGNLSNDGDGARSYTPGSLDNETQGAFYVLTEDLKKTGEPTLITYAGVLIGLEKTLDITLQFIHRTYDEIVYHLNDKKTPLVPFHEMFPTLCPRSIPWLEDASQDTDADEESAYPGSADEERR